MRHFRIRVFPEQWLYTMLRYMRSVCVFVFECVRECLSLSRTYTPVCNIYQQHNAQAHAVNDSPGA